MVLQLDTRKTVLLDFSLRNEQALNVLYILGTPGGQTMTLELTNASGEPLDLLAPPKKAAKPYQFELVFRPGVLNEDNRKDITVDGKGVQMSQVKNADGTVALQFTVDAQTLAPGDKLTFTLKRLAPDGRLGSRGTRVLLRYANVQVHGADQVIGGFRETHLNIVTHVGKAAIPLHLGAVGAGKVLNNGQANAPLKLRISNTSLTDDIQPGTAPVSNFYLSFDAGPVAEEWALGTVAQVAAIAVRYLRDGQLVDAALLPGKTPEWVIPVPPLSHGAYLDVVLERLSTQHPAGFTTVRLRYDNIPGYWDGQLAAQLEKSPLVVADGKVGVGTPEPTQSLDVNGGILARAHSAIKNQGAYLQWNRSNNDGETWLINQKGLSGANASIRFGSATTANVITEWARFDDSGRLGIGTPDPKMGLDVANANISGGIGFRNGAAWDHMYQMHDGETAFLRAGGAEKGISLQVGTGASGSYGDASQKYRDVMRLMPSGNVGIGTAIPALPLDVNGSMGNAYNVGTDQHDIASRGTWRLGRFNSKEFAGIETEIVAGKGVQPKQNGNGANLKFYTWGCNTSIAREVMRIDQLGRVGIGTSSPEVPLHVAAKVPYSAGPYGYISQDGSGRVTGKTSFEVSIQADGRIVAPEMDALSDARLKTVVGRSDATADLARLQQLRITDYTMRDRVQFGDRQFKKIIGQELEEVFPQAVHQHTGFLPDIYVLASQAQRQGEALLLTLPAGLPQAATAGQRLKLIGSAGEVLATVAEPAAAGSQQLLVTGADSLADATEPIFVFGLEHTDVRTVDYDALGMLNVSATQALARQVQDLQRRLDAQDAKLARYEELLPTLAQQLEQQQRQLEALHGQVLEMSKTQLA